MFYLFSRSMQPKKKNLFTLIIKCKFSSLVLSSQQQLMLVLCFCQVIEIQLQAVYCMLSYRVLFSIFLINRISVNFCFLGIYFSGITFSAGGRGGEVNQKPSVGGVRIFLGTTPFYRVQNQHGP